MEKGQKYRDLGLSLADVEKYPGLVDLNRKNGEFHISYEIVFRGPFFLGPEEYYPLDLAKI